MKLMSSGVRYIIRREVDSDCFGVEKHKSGKKSLEEYLNMFNIDEYYIIKKTNVFRFLDESEIEKYAGIVLFKKSIYSKKYLERWFDFNKKYMNINFLTKPFPPEYILEKIKIIDEI